MSLSNDQVQRIARLARIALAEGESEALKARLNRVLELIDELRAVDTTGTEPMAHPLEAELHEGQRLREDEVTEEDRREAYQALAPAVAGGLYLVPKVID
ncbi:MAG TPA: Asp-tRNA(Asn)/Glu-tRNA(Gln) amidotransferase subunit GatC [Burkholderiales bacterium]|nr:Asp-tRNA(Asn)/Glu-tRNA(Gln) amidotransferase subunit GatC [Burkholderiales bacterium]